MKEKGREREKEREGERERERDGWMRSRNQNLRQDEVWPQMERER